MSKTDTSLETLQSALAYVTTRYSMTVSLQLQHCPSCTALTVIDHLERLLDHPSVQSSSVLNSTYRGLLTHWEALSDHHAANPNPQQMAYVASSGRLH